MSDYNLTNTNGLTAVNINPITSVFSNFVMDHYVRPQEITNCLSYTPGATVQDCACKLSGIPEGNGSQAAVELKSTLTTACAAGYNSAGQNKQSTPDQTVSWCLNNVPSQYSPSTTSYTEYTAWLIGCLNGVNGKH